MEAQLYRAAALAACLFSLGASHRTENFLVTSPNPAFSQAVAEKAEELRRDLAIEWLGSELPPWRDKCPITVHVGPGLGAGGQTSFMFERGRPFGWSMTIQGSPERILDSVLPHEVTHTIFATHFGRPLPRWADEGACTTVEHASERKKQEQLLFQFLTTNRGIAFNHMFAMKEYPADVLPLYAQGFSLARFLIAHRGKRQFIDYVGDGMKWNNWTRATRQHYGFESLGSLQQNWLAWVRKGQPPIDRASATLVAANERAGLTESPASTRLAADTRQVDSQGTGTAVTQVAALDRKKGGWYARTRDQAFASRQKGSSPELISNPVRGGQAVSRPQPPRQPEQRVIRWRHSPAATGTFWR